MCYDHHDTRIAASDSNNNSRSKKDKSKPDLPPYNLNPRWRGYCLLALFSTICLGSVSQVKNLSISIYDPDGNPIAGIVIGSLSLGIALLVLLHELIQHCISLGVVDFGSPNARMFDFKVLAGGKVEGFVLALIMLLWIIGLGYLTQVYGIAYSPVCMNVYWSTWLCFVTCLYTFFDWIKATSVEWKKSTATKIVCCWSHTMFRTWCILALSSLVVVGTSIEMIVEASSESDVTIQDGTTKWTEDDQRKAEVAFAIVWGLLSFLTGVLWICLTDRYGNDASASSQTTPSAAPSPKESSKQQLVELTLILVCLLFWIVGTALLTRPEGLGASIMGQAIFKMFTTVVENEATESVVFYWIPGSNLYLGVWTCFGASLYLLYQWSMEPQQQQPRRAEQQPQHQQEQP
jgi:hypothetical protein